MKHVIVITPQDANPGFALAGVRQAATSTEGLPATLAAVAREPLTGVVIVDERLVDAAARDALRDMDRRWPGLVIVLPAPMPGERAEEDYVLQLIRRAIGYQVRLS